MQFSNCCERQTFFSIHFWTWKYDLPFTSKLKDPQHGPHFEHQYVFLTSFWHYHCCVRTKHFGTKKVKLRIKRFKITNTTTTTATTSQQLKCQYCHHHDLNIRCSLFSSVCRILKKKILEVYSSNRDLLLLIDFFSPLWNWDPYFISKGVIFCE